MFDYYQDYKQVHLFHGPLLPRGFIISDNEDCPVFIYGPYSNGSIYIDYVIGSHCLVNYRIYYAPRRYSWVAQIMFNGHQKVTSYVLKATEIITKYLYNFAFDKEFREQLSIIVPGQRLITPSMRRFSHIEISVCEW